MGLSNLHWKDLGSSNPWKLWMNDCLMITAHKNTFFKGVAALPGASIVNTFQNAPLVSTTEQFMKDGAKLSFAHWATVTSWAASLLSQCAVCECVKAWKYSDIHWRPVLFFVLGWLVANVPVRHLSFSKRYKCTFFSKCTKLCVLLQACCMSKCW